jgi:hypothetical protein
VALLTTQTITRTGLAPSYAAANGGGDTVRVVPGLFLHVKNGHSSAQTVTLVTPGTVDGLAISDLPVEIGDGDEAMIPVGDVFRATNGLASITYSGVTALTIAAIRR